VHRFALALLFLQGIAVARGALFPAARRQHCALYATERATPTPPEPARVLISAFSELDQVLNNRKMNDRDIFILHQ